MRAEIKALHSPDLDDLRTSQPDDPVNFGILVQAMIGPAGEDGEESFDIMVCTPSWLTAKLAEQGPVWGRHHLFLPRYDYAAIKSAIQALCDAAEGESWDQVATYLARYGQWEFEDYQPD